MAYSHKTQFPRNYLQTVNATSTFQAIFAINTQIAITHIVVSNATAAVQSVIFRATADTPEIVRVAVPIGGTVIIPGWKLDALGLEVLTLTATAGVNVTTFYVSYAQS